MTTQVTKTVLVNVPVSRAYNQWTQFEEFPRFMGGVQSVTQLDDDRLDWVAEIAGVRRQWQARILEQVPDRKVAWAATEGATNAGSVTFEDLGGGPDVGEPVPGVRAGRASWRRLATRCISSNVRPRRTSTGSRSSSSPRSTRPGRGAEPSAATVTWYAGGRGGGRLPRRRRQGRRVRQGRRGWCRRGSGRRRRRGGGNQGSFRRQRRGRPGSVGRHPAGVEDR